MCPDRKLEWFRAQEWTPDAIEAVRNKVVHCFNESFERYSTSSSSNLMRNSFSTTSIVCCLLFRCLVVTNCLLYRILRVGKNDLRLCNPQALMISLHI